MLRPHAGREQRQTAGCAAVCRSIAAAVAVRYQRCGVIFVVVITAASACRGLWLAMGAAADVLLLQQRRRRLSLIVSAAAAVAVRNKRHGVVITGAVAAIACCRLLVAVGTSSMLRWRWIAGDLARGIGAVAAAGATAAGSVAARTGSGGHVITAWHG